MSKWHLQHWDDELVLMALTMRLSWWLSFCQWWEMIREEDEMQHCHIAFVIIVCLKRSKKGKRRSENRWDTSWVKPTNQPTSKGNTPHVEHEPMRLRHDTTRDDATQQKQFLFESAGGPFCFIRMLRRPTIGSAHFQDSYKHLHICQRDQKMAWNRGIKNKRRADN